MQSNDPIQQAMLDQLNRIEQGLNRLLQGEGLTTTGHNEG